MSYAQWIGISVKPYKLNLNIQNAQLSWGKFHREDDRDSDISSNEINQIKMRDGNSASIYSCGRSDAASGTQGSIDIYDADTAKKIGTFSWDSPWGSKHNTFGWSYSDSENYIAQVTGGNKDSGAIGNLRIEIGKIS